MTKYAFSEYSVSWLKQNRFGDEDIEMLRGILNAIEAHKGKEGRVKLPKDADEKVATLIYLLDSITDSEGRPICFEENGLIDIPDEARNYFEEDLELEELDRLTTKLRKIKFARRYSYPRRRNEEKQGRFEL